MIAVLFEVYAKSEAAESKYLEIAAELRPLLDKIEGFISVERFRGVTSEGKILSLSFWRDEQAVARWREVYEHRCAQEKGRLELFKEYRIRVFAAELVRDYGLTERAQAPQQWPQQWNDVPAL
jgi:heme-degrading monooxygenase HmoA